MAAIGGARCPALPECMSLPWGMAARRLHSGSTVPAATYSNRTRLDNPATHSACADACNGLCRCAARHHTPPRIAAHRTPRQPARHTAYWSHRCVPRIECATDCNVRANSMMEPCCACIQLPVCIRMRVRTGCALIRMWARPDSGPTALRPTACPSTRMCTRHAHNYIPNRNCIGRAAAAGADTGDTIRGMPPPTQHAHPPHHRAAGMPSTTPVLRTNAKGTGYACNGPVGATTHMWAEHVKHIHRWCGAVGYMRRPATFMWESLHRLPISRRQPYQHTHDWIRKLPAPPHRNSVQLHIQPRNKPAPA